jgi:hypothetical protein
LHLADEKITDQLVCIQGLSKCNFVGGLEVFLDHREPVPLLILLNLCFALWALEEWFQVLPDFKYGLKHFSSVL